MPYHEDLDCITKLFKLRVAFRSLCNMTLKILCIHGYRQTGAGFREKSGGFRKIFKRRCEFDAPLKIPCTEGEDQGFGWWFSKPDDSFSAKDYTDFQRGFEESAEVVKEALRTQGPIDGILAFSQGAAFATLLQMLMEHHPEEWNAPTVKFAILVAPFRSRSSVHTPLYRTDQPIKMPTLLVYGEVDNIIPREMTEDLLPYYATPHTTLVHPGGHRIPINAAAKQVYKQFIAEFTPDTK